VKNLFQNLIWPAAAGNVAWAFFTVAVQETWAAPGVFARLAVLLVLAVYLAIDWMSTESELDHLKHWYWVADAFHVVAIVALAITTQLNTRLFAGSLVAVYLTTITGHLVGAWESTGEVQKRWRSRALLASTSAVGLTLMLGLPYVVTAGTLWHLPISMAITLILWCLMRKRVYSWSTGSTGCAAQHGVERLGRRRPPAR